MFDKKNFFLFPPFSVIPRFSVSRSVNRLSFKSYTEVCFLGETAIPFEIESQVIQNRDPGLFYLPVFYSFYSFINLRGFVFGPSRLVFFVFSSFTRILSTLAVHINLVPPLFLNFVK